MNSERLSNAVVLFLIILFTIVFPAGMSWYERHERHALKQRYLHGPHPAHVHAPAQKFPPGVGAMPIAPPRTSSVADENPDFIVVVTTLPGFSSSN